MGKALSSEVGGGGAQSRSAAFGSDSSLDLQVCARMGDFSEGHTPWQLFFPLLPSESQPCCCLPALFVLTISPGLRVAAWLSIPAGLEPWAILILPLRRAHGLENNRSWSLSTLGVQIPQLLTLETSFLSLGFFSFSDRDAALLHDGMNPSGMMMRVPGWVRG